MVEQERSKGIHWYIFQRRDYANYWRRLAKMHKDAIQAEKISKQKGPSKGDRRARSQRKVRNNQRKRR